jgi:hypothetical protein
MVLPMENLQDSSANIKMLVGTVIATEYVQKEQARELLAASAEDNELLICYFCNQPIKPDESINLHHLVYKSQGGTATTPAHERCHVEFHGRQGDFIAWGKLSALTRAWAFNLKNVRTHPAYDFDRAYFLMLYAR